MCIQWLTPALILFTIFNKTVVANLVPYQEPGHRLCFFNVNMRIKQLSNTRSAIIQPIIGRDVHCRPRSISALSMTTERNLVTMGRIPWGKLQISRRQWHQIFTIIQSETHVLDLSVIIFFAFFSEKVGKFLYQTMFHRFRKCVDYENSFTKKVELNLAQAARLGLVCYVFDAIEIVMEVTGIKGKEKDFSSLIAKLIFATWIALRARLYKRQFLGATFEYVSKWGPQTKHMQTGKLEITDKITDFFLFGVLSLIWIDILQIKRGNALSSIFALGGATTLALTLALQDVAKKMINGIAISTSEVFSVGDRIRLGDGTSGVVTQVGWLSTVLRGSDEIMTKIPNTQLTDVRVSNLSRVNFSQVKQSLFFSYDYLDQIPDLVKEIREEITVSCSKVITDGSRPLYVKWFGYGPDNLEVLVDCRLRIPPTGNDYYDARQEILEAIARAMKRKNVQLSSPSFKIVEKINDVNECGGST